MCREFTQRGGIKMRRTGGVKATARFALCFVHVNRHRLRRRAVSRSVMFSLTLAGYAQARQYRAPFAYPGPLQRPVLRLLRQPDSADPMARQRTASATSCPACTNLNAQCATCSTTSVACLTCNTGYYLSSTTACTACSTPMTGCTACSSSSVCTQCAAGKLF